MNDELINKQAVLDLAYKGGNLDGMIPAYEVAKLTAVDAVKLPCKIGDPIYWNAFGMTYALKVQSITIEPFEELGFTIYCGGFSFDKRHFNKIVFFTREEAETALREKMEGER